ncbi:MAG TPA: hypothetical protein H9673_04325 [Candidatus Adamsella sp.]|nr:hypothetical protein [Candidatus Adamsella sp.]
MIQGVSSNSNSQSYYTVQQNYNTMLESAGIPSEVISQGQSAIEEYAKQNNITLPTVQQPKSNQRAQTQEGNLFGKQNDAGSEAPDMTDELISLGFPAEIIAQGQSAVDKYAEENGISLPTPPEKPNNVDSPQLNVTA